MLLAVCYDVRMWSEFSFIITLYFATHSDKWAESRVDPSDLCSDPGCRGGRRQVQDQRKRSQPGPYIQMLFFCLPRLVVYSQYIARKICLIPLHSFIYLSPLSLSKLLSLYLFWSEMQRNRKVWNEIGGNTRVRNEKFGNNRMKISVRSKLHYDSSSAVGGDSWRDNGSF